jgi:hypothetical protein
MNPKTSSKNSKMNDIKKLVAGLAVPSTETTDKPKKIVKLLKPKKSAPKK